MKKLFGFYYFDNDDEMMAGVYSLDQETDSKLLESWKVGSNEMIPKMWGCDYIQNKQICRFFCFNNFYLLYLF